MTFDIRWKQRFDNFQRALHQLTLAMELKAQRPLSSHTDNRTVADTLAASIAERYYPAFCELQQRFAQEA
ncbi:MAG: hypothetical protein EA403_01340 [Spirochaetaceae bacterium]|nr:MAG: hypothetical protein EA403_01340 [Spirochaetaceae bacterium]